MAVNRKVMAAGAAAVALLGGITYGVSQDDDLRMLEIYGGRNFMPPGASTAWYVRTDDDKRPARTIAWFSENPEFVTPVRPTSGFLYSFEAGYTAIHVRAVVDGDTLCAARLARVYAQVSGVDEVPPLQQTINYPCSTTMDTIPDLVAPLEVVPQYPCARVHDAQYIWRDADTAYFIPKGLVDPSLDRPWCVPYNVVVYEEGELVDTLNPKPPDAEIWHRIIEPIRRADMPGYREP